MIKDLISIKLYNYVTHKDSFIDLSRKGSYFITSNNLDNKTMDGNGSGKSLILDSFFFALWGKPIRNSSPDNIVGLFDKYCSVEVVLELDDGNYYKVVRYRKHPKHRNRPFIFSSKDMKKWTNNLGKETASETDLYISRLLSINYDTAMSSIVITKPRHDLNFCESKDTKRKEILSNLLNLQWINEAYLKSKEDNKKYNRIIVDLNIKNRDIINKIENMSSSLVLYKRESSRFINNKKEKLISLSKELTELKNSVDKDEILNYIKILDKKIKLNDSKINKFYIELSKKDSSENIKEDKYALGYKLRHIYNSLENNESSIRDLLNLNKNKKCRLCGSITKINYGLKNKNISRIKKLEEENKSLLADVKILKDKIKKIDKKILEFDSSDRKKIISSIKKIEIKNNSFKDEKRELKTSLSLLTSQIKKINNEILELKESKNIWLKKINECEDKISRYKEINYSIDEKIKINNRLLKDSGYAMVAFGNSGIKNDIISSKITLLENTINDFLKKLSGDIYVTLDNKIKHGQSERIGLMIKDNKKVKPLDYLEWSGGEKTRIRIATELSINYIQDNFLNFLFIDEGFDDLDKMGLKILLDMFKAQKMKKIICISNRPDTTDIFKNKINVIMENGISRVEQK